MSATTVLLTLPTDVLQRTLRAAAVAVVPLVAVVPALTRSATTRAIFAATAEEAAHEGDRVQCPHCQLVGHEIRWRGYPVLDPGPCPLGGVLDDVVGACACCFWGPSAEPLFARLEREKHDDRDVHVEHLGRDGRWSKFEVRF